MVFPLVTYAKANTINLALLDYNNLTPIFTYPVNTISYGAPYINSIFSSGIKSTLVDALSCLTYKDKSILTLTTSTTQNTSLTIAAGNYNFYKDNISISLVPPSSYDGSNFDWRISSISNNETGTNIYNVPISWNVITAAFSQSSYTLKGGVNNGSCALHIPGSGIALGAMGYKTITAATGTLDLLYFSDDLSNYTVTSVINATDASEVDSLKTGFYYGAMYLAGIYTIIRTGNIFSPNKYVFKFDLAGFSVAKQLEFDDPVYNTDFIYVGSMMDNSIFFWVSGITEVNKLYFVRIYPYTETYDVIICDCPAESYNQLINNQSFSLAEYSVGYSLIGSDGSNIYEYIASSAPNPPRIRFPVKLECSDYCVPLLKQRK